MQAPLDLAERISEPRNACLGREVIFPSLSSSGRQCEAEPGWARRRFGLLGSELVEPPQDANVSSACAALAAVLGVPLLATA